MTTQAENERLTQVGPGTPMGTLLRRYWFPVGCSSLVTTKPQRVRILGEDLVLYRGESGKPQLMELRCAHRNVALDMGRVEGDSIRCPYHGWLFDHGGRCVAQPAEVEPGASMEKIRLRSYTTQEASGLIFAYMGPEPAPVLPLYDVMRMTKGEKQIRHEIPGVNWFQAVENMLDTAHFGWLHGHTFPFFAMKKINARFDPQDYGLDIHMNIEGAPTTEVAPYIFPATNRFALPTGAPGQPMLQAMIFRVPADDTSHHAFFLAFIPNENAAVVDDRAVRAVHEEAKFGEYLPMANDWWGIDLSDQDRMVMEQQGPISDRTREHLVASDIGIVRMRRMMHNAMDIAEAGGDPLGVIRDPAKQAVEFGALSMSAMAQSKQEDTDYRVGLFSEETEGAS